MNIYVYSDESGVFDREHNKYFVFGGVIALGEKEKEKRDHQYLRLEQELRKSESFDKSFEIKATAVKIKCKNKIIRSLNNYRKFSCVIKQEEVISNIWGNKKEKQRYLDYAYKIAIKRAFENLIDKGDINPDEVEHIYFFVDEHTTATNGKYELKEALEREFIYGTYNWKYSFYFEPIFPKAKSVHLEYCDSSARSKRLVRASDFIANKVYHHMVKGEIEKVKAIPNMHITFLPK